MSKVRYAATIVVFAIIHLIIKICNGCSMSTCNRNIFFMAKACMYTMYCTCLIKLLKILFVHLNLGVLPVTLLLRISALCSSCVPTYV